MYRLLALALILTTVVAVSIVVKNKQLTPAVSETPNPTDSSSQLNIEQLTFTFPLPRALERVTKKPFGLFVSPKNSPVSPERFTGFHTGVDFETFSEEQNIDVPISVICSGKLLVKRRASGYGGVAVQSCNINNQPVTVIYGHLKPSSITTPIGQTLAAEQEIGVLGTGYSSETDGERKHLHLGIHKGGATNILGYVQNQNQLSGWLDPLQVLSR